MKIGSPIPLCSVCIANYNGEEYLTACLESVLSQEFAYPVEIIVHDDASTDNSVAFIQSRYPQVKLIRSEKNVGFCVSNNRMVATADGNFILLLNNDAVLHKDALKTLYSESQLYGDGIFGLPQYNAETDELIDIGSIFDPFLNPIPNKERERQDVGMIIGACLWLPKTLWERLGGFPEWFESLAEDMYICCLARLWGYPVKALSQSGFDHWVGKSLGGGKILANRTLSTSKKRRALSERNKTFVMIICYPALMFWFIFPIHLVLLVLEGSLLAFVKQDKQLWTGIYWNCLKAIWQRRIELYNKRKAMQKFHKTTLGEFSRAFTLFPHKLRMLMKFGFPQVD